MCMLMCVQSVCAVYDASVCVCGCGCVCVCVCVFCEGLLELNQYTGCLDITGRFFYCINVFAHIKLTSFRVCCSLLLRVTICIFIHFRDEPIWCSLLVPNFDISGSIIFVYITNCHSAHLYSEALCIIPWEINEHVEINCNIKGRKKVLDLHWRLTRCVLGWELWRTGSAQIKDKLIEFNKIAW